MMKSSLLGDDSVVGNNLDLVCTDINLSGANLNRNMLLISVSFLSVFFKWIFSFCRSWWWQRLCTNSPINFWEKKKKKKSPLFHATGLGKSFSLLWWKFQIASSYQPIVKYAFSPEYLLLISTKDGTNRWQIYFLALFEILFNKKRFLSYLFSALHFSLKCLSMWWPLLVHETAFNQKPTDISASLLRALESASLVCSNFLFYKIISHKKCTIQLEERTKDSCL